jgi:hypothetical protein
MRLLSFHDGRMRFPIEIIPPERDVILQQLDDRDRRAVVSVDRNETTNGVSIVMARDRLTSPVVAESPLTLNYYNYAVASRHLQPSPTKRSR